MAPRAAQHDRDATFPIENFRDMHEEGLLAICVPSEEGGAGASFPTYCLAAAELGRYCGATALSWNMHVCSTLWTGALADDLDMTAEERAEHNRRRAIALPADRRRRRDLLAAVLRRRCGRRRRGRLRHRGKAGRRRLSGQRQEDFRLAFGRGRLLRRAVHRTRRRRGGHAPQHALSCRSRQCAGRLGGRRLGSARHARHGLAHAADQGRVRGRGRDADAARRLFPRRDLLAAHVPDPVADLYGARAGRLRLHGRLSARRGCRHPAGQAPHVSDQADRSRRNAHHARADQGALVPGDQRGMREPHLGAGAARLCRPVHRDGEFQCARRQGDPHLRRPGHAQEPAARAHLSRQPLRLADAAVDRGNLPRPARPRERSTEPGEKDE